MNFTEMTKFDSPKQSPGFLLWHVSTSWRRLIENALNQLDLTHPQFVILACLGWLTKDGDRITQKALGAMAGLDPNTVSQIIRGLEKKHLITRKQSTDARAKNPILTKKGSQILKKAIPAVESADAKFFQTITKTETKEMLCIFDKLSDNLSN